MLVCYSSATDQITFRTINNRLYLLLGVLKKLIEMCKPDQNVLSICETGDQLLLEETNKVFRKEKELKKGIAFPTCVSVNNCICHFSPLKSDPEYLLKDGDLVKL